MGCNRGLQNNELWGEDECQERTELEGLILIANKRKMLFFKYNAYLRNSLP